MIRVFQIDGGNYRCAWHCKFDFETMDMTFSPESSNLVLAFDDGNLKIIRIVKGLIIEPVDLKPTHMTGFKAQVVDFNLTGSRLMVGRDGMIIPLNQIDGVVYIYAFEQDNLIAPLCNLAHESGIVDAAWSNSGDRVAAADQSGVIKIWGFDVLSRSWKSVTRMLLLLNLQ
jgi:WD40 repeat protein